MTVRAALLLTESEVVELTGKSFDFFKRKKLPVAGSYTPPRSRSIPLYARRDVERLVRNG